MNDYDMEPKKGLAIASLVCGILSLFFSWFYVGIPLGILAIIFGAVAPKNKMGRMQGMSVAGIVMGIITVVFCILFIFLISSYVYSIAT